MLKVKTYLERSTIHGIGLFAGENIDIGAEIWEFNPHVDLSFTREEWLELIGSLTPEVRKTIRQHSYKEQGCYYLCLDNAQFMNHSRDRCNVGNDRESNIMNALISIRKGEELLCDYFEYSDPDDYHLAFI